MASRFVLARSLSLKPRSIVSPTNISPIWKRKTLFPVLSADPTLESPIIPCLSPSSTISSDRDNMSLQSTSSGSNSSSLSNRTSSNSIEFHQQQILMEENSSIFEGEERLRLMRINEIYRRRCYRAGLNIFNKYV